MQAWGKISVIYGLEIQVPWNLEGCMWAMDEHIDLGPKTTHLWGGGTQMRAQMGSHMTWDRGTLTCGRSQNKL